jgi:site-specific DNA-methyltransferase (adenine-specific)
MTKDSGGTRKGFKNTTYRVEQLSEHKYDDSFQDFWGFLRPRLIEAHRILKESGTLYLHLDYREIHYARIELDNIFGPENFLNEIIWAYDYGAKQKHKWPTKHDNILVYVKNASKHYFNSNSVNRETYRTPNLAPTKKDNLPMDVWWHTIVSPNSKEKTGYPTQKPSGILRRIISASSKKGDIVLDFLLVVEQLALWHMNSIAILC